MSELSSMTAQELDWIAKNTRDPKTLPSGTLERMKQVRVGPFAYSDEEWEAAFRQKGPPDLRRDNRMTRVRRHFLRSTSGVTLAYQIGEMHEVSHRSVILRTGLRLGFIQPMGNA